MRTRSLAVASLALALTACTTSGLVHTNAPGALGPYSATVASGDLVFVSGRIGATKGELEEEVKTAIGALDVELKRAGSGLDHVMMMTCYLTDIGAYERFNAVYASLVPKPWPARAVVAVSALPAGAHVELAAVARRR